MKFEDLCKIDFSSHIEKKGDLNYVSWTWAWSEFKKNCPDATYRIMTFDGLPYAYDDKTGYMVYTEMTVEGETQMMWLPVMDGSNNAMKSEPYTKRIKNKNFKWAKLNPNDGKYYDKYGNEQTEYDYKDVEAATMFDINKTIMRCLVKNMAMFGLGLYIYAGEDLPEDIESSVVRCKCGREITPIEQSDGTVMSVQEVVKFSLDNYKEVLCKECMLEKSRKKAADKQ